MGSILIDPEMTDAERREVLYDGTILSVTPRRSTAALCDLAWEMICDAFGSIDPLEAQDVLPVEEFARVIGPMKTAFTHEPRSKQLITAMLVDLGCESDQTYFDIPRLRVVSHATSGTPLPRVRSTGGCRSTASARRVRLRSTRNGGTGRFPTARAGSTRTSGTQPGVPMRRST